MKIGCWRRIDNEFVEAHLLEVSPSIYLIIRAVINSQFPGLQNRYIVAKSGRKLRSLFKRLSPKSHKAFSLFELHLFLQVFVQKVQRLQCGISRRFAAPAVAFVGELYVRDFGSDFFHLLGEQS